MIAALGVLLLNNFAAPVGAPPLAFALFPGRCPAGSGHPPLATEEPST